MIQILVLIVALVPLVAADANLAPQESQQQVVISDGAGNFPYYLQSPINVATVDSQPTPLVQPATSDLVGASPQVAQRVVKQNRVRPTYPAGARKFNGPPAEVVGQKISQPKETCLYQRDYFSKLDECLSKKPYPTVGLPAFKNEDLLFKKSFSDRHGCVFILNNGLFKNYNINKSSLESDSQCLDGSKIALSLSISNVTLIYLWSLQCLNKADQVLDDATMDGLITEPLETDSKSSSICVGSSRNFGFASLQLSEIEAQVDFYPDLFKNWRITNVTMASVNHLNFPSTARSGLSSTNSVEPDELFGTSIKDYTFESLDGDELNWRYLHLFKNWSRNRLHTNFLDQYRRFLWISVQRCLSEMSSKLPVKVVDIFADQQYS